jgi:hypothetical protein
MGTGMNWKNLLESVSESINDELRLRNAYLVAENRILRHQIDGRVQLTDSERKELAEIGTKLGKPALVEIATVAQADTIFAWHRKFAHQTVDTSDSSKSVAQFITICSASTLAEERSIFSPLQSQSHAKRRASAIFTRS